MRRTPTLLCLLAATLLPDPAAAQESSSAFAVLPFENSGSYGQDKSVFQALELGLASLVASALERSPGSGTNTLERARLDQALRARSVGQRFDAATAAQIGKESGARYVVTGSFADFYGKFRVNARVVDAQRGEILQVVSNDAKLQDRAQLWGIIQNVAEKIAATAHLPAPSSAGAAPVPTDAIIDYSRGLLQESEGDKAKARESYQKALSASPGFAEASAALQRVS